MTHMTAGWRYWISIVKLTPDHIGAPQKVSEETATIVAEVQLGFHKMVGY